MTERFEFGSKEAADAFREEHEQHLCTDDNRRLKTVPLSSDAPERALEEATVHAASGHADQDARGGQVELTVQEKERVGPFEGSNNYRKVTAVKGLMTDAGVDEHREITK
ncbi:hypothetical protein [Halopiger aswanensis]|uniref:Uncharacterized protein n=1 Tax=Halopiger aswanensis TaxID=148449 RepID=A0A419VU91_9EURY|nr:hypothetical protein [Halopiger aswanensis]RKD85004.1 hypothetical protein ATJ93_4773 [Halopiger aswanensis]